MSRARTSSIIRIAVRRIRSVRTVNRVVTNCFVKVARFSTSVAQALELHSIRAGEVRVELPNGRHLALWSDAEDAWPSRLWWHGWDTYERDSIRPWFRLAQHAHTVLDVGANFGLFGIVAGLANPDARCFAFEPIPATRERLERNVRINPLSHVVAVPAAAGETTGTIEIYSDPSARNDYMATVDPSQQSRSSNLTRHTVPVVSLDEWATSTGITQVDLVKIDVEGHEPEVLNGMKSLLAHRPDMFVEILDDRTATAVSEVIRQLGYNHYLLTPVGPIRTQQVAPHVCLNHLLTARDDVAVNALW